MPYLGLLHELAMCDVLDVTASDNTLTHVLTDPVLVEHLVAVYASVGEAISGRAVVIEFLDASNAVLVSHFGDLAQLGDLTRWYAIGRGLPSEGAFVAAVGQRPALLYRLEAGWKIRIRDGNGVTSNDTIRLLGTVRTLKPVRE